jgi:hypothetical protein
MDGARGGVMCVFGSGHWLALKKKSTTSLFRRQPVTSEVPLHPIIPTTSFPNVKAAKITIEYWLQTTMQHWFFVVKQPFLRIPLFKEMKNSAAEHVPLSMMAPAKYGLLTGDTRCQQTLPMNNGV